MVLKSIMLTERSLTLKSEVLDDSIYQALKHKALGTERSVGMESGLGRRSDPKEEPWQW